MNKESKSFQIAAAICLVALLVQPLVAGDWPQILGPRRDDLEGLQAFAFSYGYIKALLHALETTG